MDNRCKDCVHNAKPENNMDGVLFNECHLCVDHGEDMLEATRKSDVRKGLEWLERNEWS